MASSGNSNVVTVTTLSSSSRNMSTACQTIQLLHPCECDDPTIIDPANSLATEEGNEFALQIGVTEYNVTFGTEKVSAEYDFVEDDISNDGDVDFLVIGYTLAERTAEGFTLTLDSEPDTNNYLFRWRVRVNTV